MTMTDSHCLQCDCDACLPASLTERFVISAKERARADANRRCEHGMLRSAGCVVVSCVHWDGKKHTDDSTTIARGMKLGRKGGKS